MEKIKDGIIHYAVAYDGGDPSVGIWSSSVTIGEDKKTGTGFLLDLNMYSDEEHEEIIEELRDKLLDAMSLCLDQPKIYFDFEWERL